MRLSNKQIEFLQAIADVSQNRLIPGKVTPLYWGAIPNGVWFSFRTENEVRRWIENLADRKLIRIDKDFFYYLTPKGWLALRANQGR